jgi:acetate kinase
MGTRSGAIDPAVFGYLSRAAGLTVDEVTEVLNTGSGLRGLSEMSNDIRPIEDAAARGDDRALLALEVFVHRLAKAVAALVVSLGRLDALVFTGGIGENDPLVRRGAVEALAFLGLGLDAEANERHGRGTGGRISTSTSPVALVVPTDEERLIAEDTASLVRATHGPEQG